MLFASPVPPSALPPSAISLSSSKSSGRSTMKLKKSRSERRNDKSNPDDASRLIDDTESKRSYVDSWVESQSEEQSNSSSSTTGSSKKRGKWHPVNMLKATGKFLVNGLILTYDPLYKDMDPDFMLLHIY